VTVSELISILAAMPPTLQVIVSSQGETTQVPLECKVEPTCNEDEGGEAEEIVRLYTDNGERD
jgi:hypothetical protein